MAEVAEQWPAFFPQGCPPPAAGAPQGSLYRFIEGDAPSESDFDSHLETKGADWVKAHSKDASEYCDFCGVSLIRDIADVVAYRKRYRGFRSKRVAHGDLSDVAGRLLLTPTALAASHHTLWLTVGTDVAGRFAVAGEV